MNSIAAPAANRLWRWLIGVVAVAVLVSVAGTVAAQPAQAAEGSWNVFSSDNQATDTPAVVNFAGVTYTVLRGANGQIYWSNGQFVTPFRLMPGGWQTPFAPAATVYQGNLTVFIRGNGNDRRIYFRSLTNVVSNQWTSWTSVPGSDSIGTPSVVVAGNAIAIYYTDPQRNIRFAIYDGTQSIGQRWRFIGATVPGAVTNSSPTAVAYGFTTVAIFHRGTDNRVYRRNYDRETNEYLGDWTPVGNLLATGRIAATVTGTLRDQIELAARGPFDLIWASTYVGDQVTQGWHPVNGGTHDPVAANWAPTLYTSSAVGAVINTLRVYLIIAERAQHDLWTKQLL